jgi:hypothetical protein
VAQRRTRLSPGDFTGKEKERVSKESAEEQTQRQRQISMATAAEEEELQSGVHDPQSQSIIEHFGNGNEAVEVGDLGEDDFDSQEPIVVEPRRPPTFGRADEEPVLTGQESPDMVDSILSRYEQPRSSASSVEQLLSPMVVIRTDEDVDRMTYGMRNGEPNEFTFRAGVAYKVPREIAQHLRDRNLVRSFH